MILGGRPNQCEKAKQEKFKPCDGNLCGGDSGCQPTQQWVETNCLTPFQRTGTVPGVCVCGNSDRESATTNIFIHNDTLDTLKLVEDAVGRDGEITTVKCEGNFSNCSSTVRTDYDADKCRIGLIVYPASGTFPATIPPKTSVFIRSHSGQFGGDTCNHDAWFNTNVRYQISNDASSTVQIDAQRKRKSGCSLGHGSGRITHHFEQLSSSNTKAIAAGSLTATGTVPGGSTYSVVVSGGTSNGKGCPNKCSSGTQCDPKSGQCIPDVPCTGTASGCELDWYCGPNSVCIPGCTSSSDNCSPGKTCMDGVCTTGTGTNGDNGVNKRLRNILIITFIVVFVIVIFVGIVYFAKSA